MENKPLFLFLKMVKELSDFPLIFQKMLRGGLIVSKPKKEKETCNVSPFTSSFKYFAIQNETRKINDDIAEEQKKVKEKLENFSENKKIKSEEQKSC